MFHSCFIYISSIFHLYFIYISSIFHLYFIYISSIFYLCFIYVSSMFHPCNDISFIFHSYFIHISSIENEGQRKIQPQPLQYPPLLGPGWDYRTSPLSVEKLGPKRGWFCSIGAFLGLQLQIIVKISKIRGPSARSNCSFHAFNALFSLRKLEGIDATWCEKLEVKHTIGTCFKAQNQVQKWPPYKSTFPRSRVTLYNHEMGVNCEKKSSVGILCPSKW